MLLIVTVPDCIMFHMQTLDVSCHVNATDSVFNCHSCCRLRYVSGVDLNVSCHINITGIVVIVIVVSRLRYLPYVDLDMSCITDIIDMGLS
jgi:hypothetical protein